MKKIVHPAQSHSSAMFSGTPSVPRPHPGKLSRAPQAGGNGEYFNDGGQDSPTAVVPNGTKEDRRKPSTPDSMKDRSRADKEKLHGKFGVDSRGHKYEYSEVKDAVPTKRTDVEQHKYERAHGNPKLRGKDRF